MQLLHGLQCAEAFFGWAEEILANQSAINVALETLNDLVVRINLKLARDRLHHIPPHLGGDSSDVPQRIEDGGGATVSCNDDWLILIDEIGEIRTELPHGGALHAGV